MKEHLLLRGTETLFGLSLAHGPSIGKAENMVKLVKRGLQYWARENNYQNLDNWNEALEGVMIDINDRLPKTNKYSPKSCMGGR